MERGSSEKLRDRLRRAYMGVTRRCKGRVHEAMKGYIRCCGSQEAPPDPPPRLVDIMLPAKRSTISKHHGRQHSAAAGINNVNAARG